MHLIKYVVLVLIKPVLKDLATWMEPENDNFK